MLSRLLRGRAIATEIELKLAVGPADLPALRDALERLSARPAEKPLTLLSTYYDTAEGTLRQSGLSLRVREAGGRFVQTVKTAPPAAGEGLARGEWEDRLPSPAPDPHAPNGGRVLPAGLDGRLAALFVTEVARTRLMLTPLPAIRIEAAIDEGVIRSLADGACEPISEIELELKAGGIAVLYEMAQHLLERAPLRVATASKSARGYRLGSAAAPPPQSVHAGRLALDGMMTAEAAVQAIARHCLAHVLANEAAALSGEPNGIHQMRVAVRRLRAALAAFAPLLPKAQRRAIDRELRWFATALGRARDLDVLAETMARPPEAELPPPRARAALGRAIERQRRIAYERAGEAILSNRYTAMLLRLLGWIEGRGWREPPHFTGLSPLLSPIGEIAPLILDRRSRIVAERSAGFADQKPQRRHELRIALKKLRYAAELLSSLFEPAAVGAFVEAIKIVQDDLGRGSDVSTGHRLVARLGRRAADRAPVATAGATILAWHEARLLRHEPALRRHLSRLLQTRPFWRPPPPPDDGP